MQTLDEPRDPGDLIRRLRDGHPSTHDLDAWLFAVLRRSFLRDRRRSGEEFSPEPARDVSGSEACAVRDALGRLTRSQRQALLLVTVEDLPPQAAAAIIDCPVDVVREDLAEAHDRLARDLDPA